VNKRTFLKAAASLPLLPVILSTAVSVALGEERSVAPPRSRVRPGDPRWPSQVAWNDLDQAVGGRLLKLESPFAACGATPVSAACREALAHIDNAFYIGDQPALTQSSGWANAWISRPSAYAVAAKTTADVVAAVDFARRHHLRLVVKGGGHSYQGTSSAPDSLLVWTRHMNDVALHDAFVAQGCSGTSPQPAVTIGAGAMWIDAYDAVTTRGGRYVQGGGCTTVGVAGLVQSGGFGSFSKHYGTAAAGLLEAEIVTADGKVRIANACTNPDLFWGLKGGGGGSLGVVTRLTLRTRELPGDFGAVFGSIQASSDEAYRALIARIVDFYQTTLFNSHWGEQIAFRSGNRLRVSMVFQGLSQQQAQDAWSPFLAWLAADKAYSVDSPFRILALPARHFWDAGFLHRHAPGFMVADDRPGAPAHHVQWAGDQGQVGQFVHGYHSAWLPAALLQRGRQPQLVDALFAASRHWDFALHFNKGLAGAPAEAIAAAKDTAMNPDVLDAFALMIMGAEGAPAYPGMPGAAHDPADARRDAAMIDKAARELSKVAPGAGSYVSESDYFQRSWQRAFWGANHPRLAAVKARYDPHGLFFVHHGVGSEAWSDDGFTRVLPGYVQG
jgi:FAD/FMN-containing dehydrogenase